MGLYKWLKLVILLAFVLISVILTLMVLPFPAKAFATCSHPGTHVSIQAALDDANCDIIMIGSGTFTENLTSTVTSRNVTIIGAGQNATFIDGNNTDRVLNIQGTGYEITLQDLTVQNGVIGGNSLCPTSCGGGIVTSIPITLTNVKLKNNAAGRDGGGLAALDSSQLNNVSFEQNHADFDGGGLAAEGPTNIQNSTFILNSSTLAGGGATVGPANIVGTLFQQNTSTNNVGGALRISGNTTIQTSSFYSNTTQVTSSLGIGHGGAIYAFEANLEVNDSHFEGNSTAQEDADGGGIYMSTSFVPISLEVAGTTFKNNSTERDGGGISIGGGQPATLTVDNSTFEGNHAGSNTGSPFSDGGGGISAQRIVCTDSTFYGNDSGKDGGGIWSGASLSSNNCQLEENSAARHGGGIAVRAFASIPILVNSNLISNTTDENGGGLWVELAGASISGGTIDQNTAPTGNGGGLWLNGTPYITDTIISQNVAENGGGIEVSNGDVYFSNVTCNNNTATETPTFFSEGGGCVRINPGSFYDLGSGSTISGNNTNALGAGIKARQGTLENTTITNNQAQSNGGGGSFSGSITATNVLIQLNSAGFAGGGFSTSSNNQAFVVKIIDSVIDQNSSTAFGGGFSTQAGFVDASAWFTDTTITNNSAPGGGGGGFSTIPTFFVGTSTPTKCILRFNDSLSGSGGGMLGSFEEISVQNCNLNNNEAINGGAISSNGTITITMSIATQNSVTQDGGAFYTSGRVKFIQSTAIENFAGSDGGCIFANSGTTLDQSTITQCQATSGDGGGIASPLGEFFFNDSIISSNIAGDEGGGAYTTFRANVDTSVIDDNDAGGDGGGVRSGHRTIFSRVQCSNNDSGGDGGCLYVHRGNDSRVVNSFITNNIATDKGEELYIFHSSGSGGTMDLVHNTFGSSNFNAGTAIHINQGTVVFTNNIVSNYGVGISQNGSSTVRENYTDFFANTQNTQNTVGGGIGSIVDDPAFKNPASNDFHLTNSSAAIDIAIDTGVNNDFDGDARPTGDGREIGADELQSNTYLPIIIRNK